MAFPIIPRRRSGSAGNPASLQLGELAVNTATGKLYLGADLGVAEIGIPVAAGTTVTEHTGNGTTVAFTFAGYTSTDDGAYLVTVGGIDQPPSKYSISSAAGGTLTFVEAPVAGELISIRAIVAGVSGGGGGSGDATSIQGVDVSATAPTNGQVLAYNSTTDQWEPTSLNGSVTFNSAGTHTWAVPAWVRWVYVSANAGSGSDGTATNGEDGQVGTNASYGIPPTTGANGADGTATPGVAGKSVTSTAIDIALAGGAAGLEGLQGYGGGGSGGASADDFGYPAANGGDALGIGGGFGGAGAQFSITNGDGGQSGGEPATSGANGADGGAGGIGVGGGGDGGAGSISGFLTGNGGGGGGGNYRAGGGGGGGACLTSSQIGSAGAPGKGGIADTSMCAGGTGESFAGPKDVSAFAGSNISILISEGAGTASITISW